VPVYLRLGPRQYDAVYAQARRDRQSVNEWIRRALDEDLVPNNRNRK
jgi:predicted HicB family RNase H-like nuclease